MLAIASLLAIAGLGLLAVAGLGLLAIGIRGTVAGARAGEARFAEALRSAGCYGLIESRAEGVSCSTRLSTVA